LTTIQAAPSYAGPISELSFPKHAREHVIYTINSTVPTPPAKQARVVSEVFAWPGMGEVEALPAFRQFLPGNGVSDAGPSNVPGGDTPPIPSSPTVTPAMSHRSNSPAAEEAKTEKMPTTQPAPAPAQPVPPPAPSQPIPMESAAPMDSTGVTPPPMDPGLGPAQTLSLHQLITEGNLKTQESIAVMHGDLKHVQADIKGVKYQVDNLEGFTKNEFRRIDTTILQQGNDMKDVAKELESMKAQIEELKRQPRAQSAPPRSRNLPASALGSDFFEVKATGWPYSRERDERVEFGVIAAHLGNMFSVFPYEVKIVDPPTPFPKFLLLRFESFANKTDFLKAVNANPMPPLVTPFGHHPIRFGSTLPEYLAVPNKIIRFTSWKLKSILEPLGIDVKKVVLSQLRERELCIGRHGICYYVNSDNRIIEGLHGGKFCINLQKIKTACHGMGITAEVGEHLCHAIVERFPDEEIVRV